jgi:hypothetical protein
MSTPEHDAQESERRKKTMWLLIGGAASLLLPLLGALYMRWAENAAPASAGNRSDVFQRRDQDDSKVVPTRTVVVPPMAAPPPSAPALGSAPPAESSLDFIKPAEELEAKPAPAKAAAAAPAAKTAAAPPPSPVAKTRAKSVRKAFTMPKLQPTRGFTKFGSSGSSAQGQGSSGGQSAQDMLKNLPPGAANNPEIQKYLQQQQGQGQ